MLDVPMFSEDYGRSGGGVEDDLLILRDIIVHSQTLIKDFDRYYLPDNAALVRFLQGHNPEKLAWLPLEHPCIAEDGSILDRDMSPIDFHRISGLKFELRAVGDDRIPWTEDDVVVR